MDFLPDKVTEDGPPGCAWRTEGIDVYCLHSFTLPAFIWSARFHAYVYPSLLFFFVVTFFFQRSFGQLDLGLDTFPSPDADGSLTPVTISAT